MNKGVFANITLELSKAGIRAYCEELDEDVFCVDGSLEPLVELINRADSLCNPETTFRLTEKGRRELKRIMNNKK